MSNILDKVLLTKQEEIAFAKTKIPLNKIKKLAQYSPKCRDFTAILLDSINAKHTTIIAEIKKASPSRGVIREDFNIRELASDYQSGGAICLSILTDKDYFQGDISYIAQAKQVSNLPILRKDFIIDEYQVYQSKVLAADAILLIVSALDDKNMVKLFNLANNLGMSVLVEVHNKDELMRALKLDLKIIGINNRDLKTFTTNLNTTINLLPYIPNETKVITESGIFSNNDIKKMQSKSVYGFLVGEALISQKNITLALQKLIGVI